MTNTIRSKQKFALAVSLATAMLAGLAQTAASAPAQSSSNAVLTITNNPPGLGSVSPNDNGKSLKVGKVYTLTAKPAKGCAFVNWTGSTNSDSKKLTFSMEPDLSFTANFADLARPVLAVLSPKAKQKVADSSITASGKTKDNVGVVGVYYQFNGGDWTLANGFTSWTTAELSLIPGTNVIAAYAVDFAGNVSLTNRITFLHPFIPTGIYVGQIDDVSGPGGFALFVDSKNSALVIGGDSYNNDDGDAIYGSCTLANGHGLSSISGNNLGITVDTNELAVVTVTAPVPIEIAGPLVSDGPFKLVAGTYTAKVSGKTVQAILSPDGWFYLSSPNHDGGGRCQFTAFGQPTSLTALGHTVGSATPNASTTITLTAVSSSETVNVTMKRVDALP